MFHSRCDSAPTPATHDENVTGVQDDEGLSLGVDVPMPLLIGPLGLQLFFVPAKFLRRGSQPLALFPFPQQPLGRSVQPRVGLVLENDQQFLDKRRPSGRRQLRSENSPSISTSARRIVTSGSASNRSMIACGSPPKGASQ